MHGLCLRRCAASPIETQFSVDKDHAHVSCLGHSVAPLKSSVVISWTTFCLGQQNLQRTTCNLPLKVFTCFLRGMEERPPTPPDGSPGSAKDGAVSQAAPLGEVQELLSMDMWSAVLIAVMMLLGLMQGVMAESKGCYIYRCFCGQPVHGIYSCRAHGPKM